MPISKMMPLYVFGFLPRNERQRKLLGQMFNKIYYLISLSVTLNSFTIRFTDSIQILNKAGDM